MKYTAYDNRKRTDRFFPLEDGSCIYEGQLPGMIHFVEEKQFLDPALWSLFVEQFRIGSADDHDLGWRGEYWGKMMRGACFTYRYTQNEKLYQILEDTVRDMMTCQDRYGRISTYSIPFEFHGWDVWGRKYVMLGFEYFLEICRDDGLSEKIIEALCRHADYMLLKIGCHAVGKIPVTNTSEWWKGMNSSSVLEPFVRLYNLTGMDKYLDFAGEIIESGGTDGFNIFEAALEDQLYPYQYPVTKAYEMMSNFEGIIEYYRATGKEKYRKMAVRFARRIMESDITVIGGAGTTHELFDHSAVRQFNPAFKGIMQETCVTVTWMKLCWQLLCLTGDSLYADQMEISIYNALLGAVNVEERSVKKQTFAFDSYSPLLNSSRGREVGGYKDMIKNQFWWGCCVAIGGAGTGLVAGTAHQKARDGLAVNFYLPGEVKTTLDNGRKIRLITDTLYPLKGEVHMEVLCDQEEKFTMYLRIPFWSENTVLKVNGKEVKTRCGTYTQVERMWKNGDTLDLSLDMRTKIIRAGELDPGADEKSICHAALRRGPVMLARDSQTGENIREAVTLEDENGYAVLEKCEEEYFPARQIWRVKTREGFITAADYASCGQNWDENMPITVWITTK